MTLAVLVKISAKQMNLHSENGTAEAESFARMENPKTCVDLLVEDGWLMVAPQVSRERRNPALQRGLRGRMRSSCEDRELTPELPSNRWKLRRCAESSKHFNIVISG